MRIRASLLAMEIFVEIGRVECQQYLYVPFYPLQGNIVILLSSPFILCKPNIPAPSTSLFRSTGNDVALSMSQRLGESIGPSSDTHETLNLTACRPVVSKEIQEADILVC